MANVFITTKQAIDNMMASARREVDKIPVESCRSIYDPWLEGGMRAGYGVGGALGVCFILACMERVDREEFAGYGAD